MNAAAIKRMASIMIARGAHKIVVNAQQGTVRGYFLAHDRNYSASMYSHSQTERI